MQVRGEIARNVFGKVDTFATYHSPEMNYSRIVLVEAIMAVKRPPVMIPLSGRVPKQDSRSPRLDFRADGAFVSVSWKVYPSPIFLGLKAIYR